MLAIRMQRTGRKGHAMFRVIVQDAQRTPTSGKIVAQLGSYDPHSKTVTLNKEKAAFYLEHGAQPSERAVTLLQKEGVKLPAWVKTAPKRESSTRNPDKRRSTRPAEPEAEEAAPTEGPAAESAEAAEVEAPAEAAQASEAEAPAEPAAEEAPAEEAPGEESAENAEETPAETPEPEAEKPAKEADEKDSKESK